MFRKRVKKEYPEGTFIPMPARVCAILQLCLAFSAFLWVASEPFVGEIFAVKSHLLYYQDVMGVSSHVNMDDEKRSRLERNEQRFARLPVEEQKVLKGDYDDLQGLLQRTFLDKMLRVVKLFTSYLSGYELAWIILSIVLSIMVLKKVEGAAEAVWLLPLLVAAYAVDLRYAGKAARLEGDERLFPKETELVAQYIGSSLDGDLFEQQKQLRMAWKKYLAGHWAKMEPGVGEELDKQAEEGEFYFTLARIKARRDMATPVRLLERAPSPPSLLLLVVYFFWNTYFAYTVWKYRPYLEQTGRS